MQPGNVIFREDEPQPRKTFEHPAENEISEEIQRLQDSAANRISALLKFSNHFEPCSHSISALDDVDVEVQRKIHILSSCPQRIKTGIGITDPIRQLRW